MDDLNLDSFLADVHRLLDEAEERDPQVEPDDGLPEEDALDFLHEDVPAPQPTVSDETMVYQPPVQRPSWAETQRLPRHVAKLQQNQEQAYADWLFEQGQRHNDAPPPPPPGRKVRRHPQPVPEEEPEIETPKKQKKKRHGFRNFVIFLLLLALALLAVVVFALPRQPKAAGGGVRKDGVSTILLAGTDQGGTRTDTLMLFSVDASAGTMSLVSIPRDTLVTGPYAIPKINSVYAVNNGGQEGMEMLLQRVGEIIGFQPDGYVLIELDAFVELVDLLGGVRFDVPQDMWYQDPAQDLSIDLKAGLQTLNGQEAMGLVRYRSGYADADLGRIRVQRDFLTAALDQAVSLNGLVKSPLLLQSFQRHVSSDLSAAQYLWLARTAAAIGASNLSAATLPGNPVNFPSGSYYVLDPALVAQTVNTYCNPYVEDVTVEDLTIRQG